MTRLRRRSLLRAGCAGLAGFLAGCGGSEAPAARCRGDPVSRACREDRIAEEYADVPNFDAIQDLTDRDEVTIWVGVPDGEGHVGFDPPVVRLAAPVRITWTWTGRGGLHDVTGQDGEGVQSDLTAGAGHDYVYEARHDGDLDFRYRCSAHGYQGARGLVLDDQRARG